SLCFCSLLLIHPSVLHCFLSSDQDKLFNFSLRTSWAFHVAAFETLLSERWHRVAIQQAAGIAQSWRTNREETYQGYLQEMEDYLQERAQPDCHRQEPVWKEWNTPLLKQTCIQANVNVAVLEPSEDSTFDYWLRISTLEKRKTIRVPVKLADYHREALKDKTINSSVTLNKRGEGWWLTLSYDQRVQVHTEPTAPVIGVDVGIANFLTSSDGKHYGTFGGKLRARHKRDREKRRRKARLRACLKKKGVEKLPSTSSRSGQRLGRHVRQEINRAVNTCLAEHPDAHIAYEHLSVASMKFKARAMNAYLYASNLAHIPRHLTWGVSKRGMSARQVKSAYSSQECHVCHYPDRANRPDQQTFCCVVCGQQAHADLNAATNLAHRWDDEQLCACKDRTAVKALLLQRHDDWKAHHGWP
ncbi:MAG TPA: transposase, partial [Ktedonobacteraceae bacterium]|nr:transposase [Ktedonobacteraceae bacterium]